MRYRVQVIGWVLIWCGVFVFGYLGWQLYVTDWINRGTQAEAADLLETELADHAPVIESIDSEDYLGTVPVPQLPGQVEFVPEEPAERGSSFGFMTIPKLGMVDLVIYEGVDTETLTKGPGHMIRTPLPGQAGNAVISGHRTTHGRPFYDFDRLAPGDRIQVTTAAGIHVYEIRETAIVEPTDVWVIDPRPGGWLTLTTCHPKFSARQRLIVWAEMVDGPNLEYVQLHEAKFG
jgi:sortase A